ncbi:DNA translocase FtsK 4TM domain-containing protein, partial [Vicingaceae bacterium]|nr:DNA translocase FtsK 4TM domain-containing protein [Vicingaceae bacterium]
MAQNRFKLDTPEENFSKKRDKKTTVKKKILGDKKVSMSKYTNFFKNEKTQQVIGLGLILTSAVLLLAFTSFLFTWKADQSKVEIPFWDYYQDTTLVAENWLGKLGAAVSHQFIYEWFGIASFFFVGLSFLIGFKILFRTSLLPIFKTIKYSIFGL